VEGRPLDDAGLIELAQHGDVRAYGELVERYREVAFRTAYLIARNAADAEDAAQDAFVKAYYALDRFRSPEPFRPWILRIVSNEARNRRRSAGRRERLALRLSERRGPGGAAPSPDAAAIADESRAPLLAAIADESRATLLAAIETLPERDRLVIGYRYLLDLSEAETAVALGVRPGTVKSRLSRALERLRAALPAGSGLGGGTDD
jgi:RNA polymerase sigma-70 factor (ECF subfamily)